MQPPDYDDAKYYHEGEQLEADAVGGDEPLCPECDAPVDYPGQWCPQCTFWANGSIR